MWQLILGPVLGTLGGIATKWMEGKEKKADRAHELAVMDKEAELADRRLKIEGELKREEMDAATFSASYQFNNTNLTPEHAKLSKGQLWLAIFVDALNRLIRPLMTVWYQFALAGCFIWAALLLHRLGIGALDAKEAQSMMHEIVYSVIGTAETILLWWFGIRGSSKRGK